MTHGANTRLPGLRPRGRLAVLGASCSHSIGQGVTAVAAHTVPAPPCPRVVSGEFFYFFLLHGARSFTDFSLILPHSPGSGGSVEGCHKGGKWENGLASLFLFPPLWPPSTDSPMTFI